MYCFILLINLFHYSFERRHLYFSEAFTLHEFHSIVLLKHTFIQSLSLLLILQIILQIPGLNIKNFFDVVQPARKIFVLNILLGISNLFLTINFVLKCFLGQLDLTIPSQVLFLLLF